MSQISWSDVVAFAPSLVNAPLTVQTSILAYVNLFPAGFWGNGDDDAPKLRLARIYYAAHAELFRRRQAGAAGEIASESVGVDSLSTSYFSAATLESALQSTSFGQQFLQLRSTCAGRIGFVV